MSRLIGIYGASGFGREVLPVLRAMENMTGTEICFIDDAVDAHSHYAGVAIVSWESFMNENATEKAVCIAIADGGIRRTVHDRCLENGIPMAHCVANNVWHSRDVQLGHGAILQPFVTLTSNARIGRCFHANIYSYVAHDCEIGDFVTFAPSVKCNGNVHIGDSAYIGTGAILRQGTPDKPLVIGAGAVVGMGAVVTKDVAPNTVVVGNPARVLVKE